MKMKPRLLLLIIFVGIANLTFKVDATVSAKHSLAQQCEANTNIRSIAFSPDNQYVLASWNLGESRLWDIKTGKVAKTWIQSSDSHAIHSVGFSQDGKSAFTAAATNVVIWDVASGNKQQILNLNAEFIDGIDATFVDDGRQIITGEIDGARLWDVSTGNLVYFFPGSIDRGLGERLQISSDGNYLLLNDDEPGKGQNLWNVKTRTIIHTFEYPTEEDFAPDNKTLIVSDSNDELYLFNIPTNKKLKTFPTSTNLGEMVFSPDGKYFLAAHGLRDIELWDVKKSVRLHTFDLLYVRYTFFPDSQRVLVLYSSSQAEQMLRFVVWDVPSNQTIREWSIPLSYGALRGIISNHGKYLWIVADNTIQLLNAQTGELIRHFCVE
jgi:WD40 repeat protein